MLTCGSSRSYEQPRTDDRADAQGYKGSGTQRTLQTVLRIRCLRH
jgi:hypothetical protein